jgi:outer membrane receptor protein involved in Fe transport
VSSLLARRLITLCLLLGAVGGGGVVWAQESPPAGTRIVDLIASLRDAGLTIVVSSELVSDAMVVTEPPPAGAPIDELRSVLAAYDLDVVSGPRGSWLVVRRRAVAQTPPTERPEAPTVELPKIETIVVSASRYTLARSADPSTEQLDRLALDHTPVLGDDALRVTNTLPGVTSSGLSARTNVRGGVDNETLFLLDGVRLYNPFHLKDFESLFSSISPRMIDHIDIHTGGYSVRYGDRMSGVVDMQTVNPTEQRHYELGVTTLTTSFQSRGRFADDRGQWLTSLRRGNLDLLIRAADSDAGTPQYLDFFSKLDYELAGGQTIGGGILAINDELSLSSPPEGSANANYNDIYLWLRFEHSPTERISGRYLLTRVETDAHRQGAIDKENVATGELSGVSRFRVDKAEADWTMRLSERQYLEWGAELGSTRAAYEFDSTRFLPYPIRVSDLETTPTSVTASLSPKETRRAAFVNYRVQPIPRMTLELGSRWDAQSYLDDEQFSPRLGMLLDIGDRTTLRASVGRFYQSQSLDELDVPDGQTDVLRAQRSDHRILSVEHVLSEALSMRVEVYDKRISNPHVRFENLFERVSLIPELLPDRVAWEPFRARARGVELGLDAETGQWRWWLSLSRNSVEDDLDGQWVRRSWEEPWSGKAGFIWSGARWVASVALTQHAGWPISRLELVDSELQVKRINGEAFELFRSLDVRVSRAVSLRRGTIEFLFELNNALDDENECCFDYSLVTSDSGAITELRTDTDNWLPIIPTVGFLWSFGTRQ